MERLTSKQGVVLLFYQDLSRCVVSHVLFVNASSATQNGVRSVQAFRSNGSIAKPLAATIAGGLFISLFAGNAAYLILILTICASGLLFTGYLSRCVVTDGCLLKINSCKTLQVGAGQRHWYRRNATRVRSDS